MATKKDQKPQRRNRWWDRGEDRNEDSVISLRISAEFEREMLALCPDPVTDGEADDIDYGYGYSRYAKGGN
jgi:hypothetical protein